jgi:hypothetical protein
MKLHEAAMRMPPELPATWEILAEAGRLEDERRQVEHVLDRW